MWSDRLEANSAPQGSGPVTAGPNRSAKASQLLVGYVLRTVMGSAAGSRGVGRPRFPTPREAKDLTRIRRETNVDQRGSVDRGRVEPGRAGSAHTHTVLRGGRPLCALLCVSGNRRARLRRPRAAEST